MSDLNFSKKGDRALSQFVGQELLYDYLRGELDAERVQALEKLLRENRDLKAELEKIRDGLHYVMDLQKTQVSASLIENIRTPSTYFQVLLQKTKFSDWPEGVKFAAEGLLIGVVSLTLIILIPWTRLLDWKSQLEQTPLVLTEVTRGNMSDPDKEVAPRQEAEVEQAVLFEDETKPIIPPKQTPPAKVTGKPTPIPPAVATAAKTPADSSPPTAVAGVVSAPAPDSGKRQGILFRGTMSVTNADSVSGKLVEFLNSNGGRKAGEVELGWKKGSGNYFHFTLPEANYKALVDYFNTFGNLKIQKEPHPRVMPDGIIRLIITVDEKN